MKLFYAQHLYSLYKKKKIQNPSNRNKNHLPNLEVKKYSIYYMHLGCNRVFFGNTYKNKHIKASETQCFFS